MFSLIGITLLDKPAVAPRSQFMITFGNRYIGGENKECDFANGPVGADARVRPYSDFVGD